MQSSASCASWFIVWLPRRHRMKLWARLQKRFTWQSWERVVWIIDTVVSFTQCQSFLLLFKTTGRVYKSAIKHLKSYKMTWRWHADWINYIFREKNCPPVPFEESKTEALMFSRSSEISLFLPACKYGNTAAKWLNHDVNTTELIQIHISSTAFLKSWSANNGRPTNSWTAFMCT